MSNVGIFLLGMFTGGVLGVVALALLSIDRLNRDDGD